MVELREWSVVGKLQEVLLRLPQRRLECVESADSVIKHHRHAIVVVFPEEIEQWVQALPIVKELG